MDAGSSGARLGDMVREVVCPRDQWLADVNAGKDFLTSLIEWETKVAAYEVASGDKISEAVRVATIIVHAPDAVKSMLRFSPLEQRRSVDALKLWIRESSYDTPRLFQGSMPMQVGAVSDGGNGKKGKIKTTGDKGKGTGKGKDKNKHKRKYGNKSKQRDSWMADEGATCLVLLDVDTGYMKAVPTAGKTVTDYLVEGGKRFVEQFFRRRVRLRCDGEPTTFGLRCKAEGKSRQISGVGTNAET